MATAWSWKKREGPIDGSSYSAGGASGAHSVDGRDAAGADALAAALAAMLAASNERKPNTVCKSSVLSCFALFLRRLCFRWAFFNFLATCWRCPRSSSASPFRLRMAARKLSAPSRRRATAGTSTIGWSAAPAGPTATGATSAWSWPPSASAGAAGTASMSDMAAGLRAMSSWRWRRLEPHFS